MLEIRHIKILGVHIKIKGIEHEYCYSILKFVYCFIYVYVF